MNDLFGPAPVAQDSPPLPAPSDAGAGAEPYAPGEPADRTSIAWFAWKQKRLYEEGARSAREYAERQAAIKRAAQEGINRAVEHADETVPGWSEVAYEFIRLHAMRNKGERMTGYEIVQAALAYGVPKPPTDKAFGGPIQRAARCGVLRKVGTVADQNPERHGSPVTLWEAA